MALPLFPVHDCPQSWPEVLSPRRLAEVDLPTPFLAFDPQSVEHHYEHFKALLREVDVFFALKCNPDPDVLATVASTGAGFEIASAAELEMACEAGARPEDVLYSNTVKPPADVAKTFASGVWRYAFDSEAELQKIARHAPGSSVYARVAVEDEHSLFPLSKKFGTSVDEAVRLLAAAADLNLIPYGVTFHVGSQCVTPQAWKRAIGRCGILMSQLDRQGVRLQMVNLGGGFPAHYVEPVPELTEVAAAIHEGLDRLPYRPDVIAAEPGRALVAESGVMVATIIGVDDRGGQRWVYLDVGGYNGMMEAVQTGGRWAFPLATSRDDAGDPLVQCTVTGPSCDSTDTMFYDVDLPCSLETGDRLYIGSAGAYTLSYASNFNGFAIPKVQPMSRGRVRLPKLLDLARGA